MSSMARGCVKCYPNCGGCFVSALKNKVCLWKVPQQRGNLEWCNMFLSTFSGKSKDPRQYTHAYTPPCRSTFLLLLFLSLENTHTHTLSAVFMTLRITTSTTTALALVYRNVDLERPQRENNKHTATISCK